MYNPLPKSKNPHAPDTKRPQAPSRSPQTVTPTAGQTQPLSAIWTGDNLHILRGMNSECVGLIYLDPPFNSNQDYAAPVGSQAAGSVCW